MSLSLSYWLFWNVKLALICLRCLLSQHNVLESNLRIIICRWRKVFFSDTSKKSDKRMDGFLQAFFSTHPSYCYFCDHRSKKWVRCYLPRPPFFICRYYRAPEVILGMDYAEKVDVWALGCIFAEMVLARTLFPGQNHVHQWLTITETLGTPNESFVSRLEPNVRRYVMGMKYFRPQSFESLFPDRQFPPSNSVSPPLLWKVVFPGFSPTVL